MFRYDLRDWNTLIFIFPVALLLTLVLSLRNSVPGFVLTGVISVNVIAFGVAYAGIFAGAMHLATWRENGMLQTVRNFPLSSSVIIASHALTGGILVLAMTVVLTVLGVILGMVLNPTVVLGLMPLLLSYLFFFPLGLIVALVAPSMVGVSLLANIVILPLGFAGGAMMPLLI